MPRFLVYRYNTSFPFSNKPNIIDQAPETKISNGFGGGGAGGETDGDRVSGEEEVRVRGGGESEEMQGDEERKEMMLMKSRGRVALAWTLVALCSGSYASHLLHADGIHVAHDLLVDGLKAFTKGSQT